MRPHDTHSGAYPLALELVTESESLAIRLRDKHRDLADRLMDASISLALDIAAGEYVVAYCSACLAAATLDLALSVRALDAEAHGRADALIGRITGVLDALEEPLPLSELN